MFSLSRSDKEHVMGRSIIKFQKYYQDLYAQNTLNKNLQQKTKI